MDNTRSENRNSTTTLCKALKKNINPIGESSYRRSQMCHENHLATHNREGGFIKNVTHQFKIL